MKEKLVELARTILQHPDSLPPEAVSFVVEHHGKIARRQYAGYDLDACEASLMILVHACKMDSAFQREFDTATREIDAADDVRTRAYAVIHQLAGTRCDNGELRRLGKGRDASLLYCGTNGACACQAKAFSETIAAKDDLAKEATKAKRKATFVDRFGVENPMLDPTVVDRLRKSVKAKPEAERALSDQKRKQTNIARFGVQNPFESEEIKTKIKDTMIAKYGVSNPGLKPELREKAGDTLERRTGYRNSFSDPTVIANTQRKNLLQKDQIVDKIKATTLERYGVEFGFQTKPRPAFHPARAHYTDLALSVLLDPANLLEFMKTRSLSQAGEELGVDKTTVWVHCRKAGMCFERNRSTYEVEIEAFLSLNGISFIKNSRHVIAPQELDFYLPDHKVGIEFNGLFFHSDAEISDRYYHLEKHETCKERGLRLISINEDEWLERKASVCGRILNVCGLSEKGPGARKLSVAAVSIAEAQSFTERFHMQGKVYNAFYAAGAYDGNQLVAIMTFSRQRGTNCVELSRFCSDGRTYAGLFSRLFKFARTDQAFNTVVTFADKRFSEGGMYLAAGFRHDGDTPVDYRYVKGTKTYHKQYLTKSNIAKKFGLDTREKTESELSRELGFHRIYDCGKMRFVWPHDANSQGEPDYDNSIDRTVKPKGPRTEKVVLAADVAVVLNNADQLKTLIDDIGISGAAKHLGISGQTVRRYSARHKIANVGHSKRFSKTAQAVFATEESLIEHLKTMSVPELAEYCDVPAGKVYRELRKHRKTK